MKKIVLLLISIIEFNVYALAGNTWTEKLPMCDKGRYGAISFSINGKGYFGLGQDSKGNNINDFWEYDPVTDIWTKKAYCPGVGYFAATAFTINGKGYVCLGKNTFNADCDDLWEYTPVTNTWRQRASFPGIARSGASSFVIGDAAFVGTGSSDDGTFLSDMWMYFPSTNTWSRTADFPGGKRMNATSFSIGSYGYMGTGLSDITTATADMWRYDRSDDSWTTVPALPDPPRTGAISLVINNKAYLGMGKDSLSLHNDFYPYDPVLNSWGSKITAPVQVLNRILSVGFTINNLGYFGTGQSAKGVLSDLWSLDPNSQNDDVIIPAPGPSSAVIANLIDPTCPDPTGTIKISTPAEGSGYVYSLDNSVRWLTTSTFTGLNIGPHIVYITNTSTGCVYETDSLLVIPVPQPPSKPVALVIQQPSCGIPVGIIKVTSPPENTGYSFSVDGFSWQATNTFIGVSPAYHYVMVMDTITKCTSAVSVDFNLIAVDAPNVVATLQPTCSAPFGNIVITAPLDPIYEYSADQSVYQHSPTFSGLSTDAHWVTARSTIDTMCISPPAKFTFDPLPARPAAPVVSAIKQPTCDAPNGTIEFTDPSEGSGFNYSVDGTTWSSTATITNLWQSRYSAMIMDIKTGCISAPVLISFSPSPGIPPTPSASIIRQPDCAVPTGAITFTSPAQGSGFEYALEDGKYQSAATFNDVSQGSHTYTVRRIIDRSCVSLPADIKLDTISYPVVPSAVVKQSSCRTVAGTILVTSPAEYTGFQYSIDQGAYQNFPSFTAVTSGNHIITVRSAADSACVSSEAFITMTTCEAHIPNANDDYVRMSWADTARINVLANDHDSNNDIIVGSVTIIDNPQMGSVVVNNDGTITYIPAVTHAGHDTFVYRIKDSANSTDSATVNIDINDPLLKIPEGFSPNGDGINDKFVIPKLEYYPDPFLAIYTRSGQIVFESNNYQNDWDGRTLINGTATSRLVPIGVYYYILKLRTVSKAIKGFIYVGY
jgi:gliding motility-associated-like protein